MANMMDVLRMARQQNSDKQQALFNHQIRLLMGDQEAARRHKLAQEMTHHQSLSGMPKQPVDIVGGIQGLLADMSPGYGDYLAARRGGLAMEQAYDQAKQGNWLNAAGKGAESLAEYISTVPGIGDLAAMTKGAASIAPGLLAMTHYHGSPHKFTKFDLSKIGTGEGAQAYGHGLYFAESPGVAKSYQTGLTRVKGGNDYRQLAKTAMNNEGLKLSDDALPVFQEFANKLETVGGKAQSYAMKAQNASRELRAHDTAAVGRAMQKYLDSINRGSFYEVDIPDEAIGRMLDWDKPLSEQPENVREALAEVAGKFGKRVDEMTREELIDILQYVDQNGVWTDADNIAEFGKAATREELLESAADMGLQEYLDMEMVGQGQETGQSLYMQLVSKLGGGKPLTNQGQAAASDYLKSLGIPGIRYLDQASRGAGDGTRNIVLFDDSLANILKINDKPVK